MSGSAVITDIWLKIDALDKLLIRLRTVDDDMFDLSTLRDVIAEALAIERPRTSVKATLLADCYGELSRAVPKEVTNDFQKLVESIRDEWKDSASVAAQRTMSNFEVRLDFLAQTLDRASETLFTYTQAVDAAAGTAKSGKSSLLTADSTAKRLGYLDAITDGTAFDRSLLFGAAMAKTGIETIRDALKAQQTALDAAMKALDQLRKGIGLRDLSDALPSQGTRVTLPDGGNVFVLPEITVHGLTGGSQVGHHFPNPDAAARAALQEIYGSSMDHNVEYAGNVYRNPDGSYSFSPPTTRNSPNFSEPSDSPVPEGAVIVGTYHSHAAGDPNTPGTGPSDELFSDENDKMKATLSQKDSYLLTPQGNLYKYTPVDNLPADEQERFRRGKVTAL